MTTMNEATIEETRMGLAAKIARVDQRLEELEQEIEEIGEPAASALRERLQALEVERRALKRNYEEACRPGGKRRMRKVDALLGHIEREEASVGHEADFLNQSAPSSVTLAVQSGVKMVSAGSERLKRILGGHHPFGESVFVNHTHDNLRDHYGLEDSPGDEPKKA